MSRPPLHLLNLAVRSYGEIDVELRGSAGGRVAVILDGSVYDIRQVSEGPRGKSRLLITLPSRTIHLELDILALPDGSSLLGLPHKLGDLYALKITEVHSNGLFLSGSFTAAPFLAADLGVEFLAGSALVAQAVATRDADGAANWRFRLPIHALLRPGATLTVQPRIASLLLPGPLLTVSAEGIGFLGCLDIASPHHVEGWAVELAHPSRPVKLDIVVDAQTVATVDADGHRPDLAHAGLSGTTCGFSASLPAHADPAAPRRVAVRLAGQRTELAGSPAHVDPVPGLIGSFDTTHGMTAHGWALNREHPEVSLLVELVGPDGDVVGTGLACQFRGDLLDAGLNGGVCAFMIDLSAHFDRLIDREVHARIAGTGQILPGSPQRVTVNPNLRRFLHRRQALAPGVLPRLRRALNHRAGDDGISFIMPVHNPPRAWLIEALESVRLQFCDAWELICVDDGSTVTHVADILAGYAARDARFRVLASPRNVGIAGAVNFGLRAARFGHVAFLDHDDKLEPDAAWQLIRAARATQADLLYSDEALTGENTDAITELRQRPAFSHDYYLSHPYFVHIVCARTTLARAIGGWDETMAISADVDFVLRMIEASRVVTHVPAVLYRWRTHGGSTGHAKQDQVMAATTGALQRHLDRLQTGARVGPGVWFNQFRIDWPDAGGLVLIVIPTKNKADLLRTAIESIERTTPAETYRLVVIDHASDDPETIGYLREVAQRHIVMPYSGKFNFSAMNNAAVARHGDGTDFVLFLNNDIEATQDGWIERMRRLAGRPDVGAVGALLMYADRRVQHAGVILGFNKSADHALKYLPVFLDQQGRRNLGYNCALTSVRDYSAVTAACMMLRLSVFRRVDGFNEDFGIGFNDTDLCLRIGEAGLRVLYDGSTLLYHYESATRSQTQQVFHPEDTARMIGKWAGIIDGGDPFYNPNLSSTTRDHTAREEAGCRIAPPPRATRLDLRALADITHETVPAARVTDRGRSARRPAGRRPAP